MALRSILLTAGLCLVPSLCVAQDASLRYATFADYPTAQAVSAAAWAAMQCQPQPSCDAGQVTKYVYPIIGLTDGRFAVVIRSGDVYQGEHLSLPNGKIFDLTANQIAALATRSGMGTLLGDIVPVAAMAARITAPQMTAINNYANAHPAFKTKWTTLQSGPVDLQATLIWDVMAELQVTAVLTMADVRTIAAARAAAVVP